MYFFGDRFTMITLMKTLWKWLLQIVDQFYKGAASPGVDLLMQMMMLMMTLLLTPMLMLAMLSKSDMG